MCASVLAVAVICSLLNETLSCNDIFKIITCFVKNRDLVYKSNWYTAWKCLIIDACQGGLFITFSKIYLEQI